MIGYKREKQAYTKFYILLMAVLFAISCFGAAKFTLSVNAAETHELITTYDALQSAINASKDGDIILIGDIPNFNNSSIPIKRNITIKSGKENQAVISVVKALAVFAPFGATGAEGTISVTFENIKFECLEQATMVHPKLGEMVVGSSAIFFTGNVKTIIKDCDFTGFEAPNGAIYGIYSAEDSRNNGLSVDLRGCKFYGNTNTHGALYTTGYGQNVKVSMENCEFYNNISSNWAGAIYVSNTALTIKNSSFTNNKGLNGGAVNINNDSTLTVEKSLFANNTADLGGALYTERTNAIIDGCVFAENSGTDKSGAAYLSTDSFHTQYIINSSFYKNIAPIDDDIYVEFQAGAGGIAPDPDEPRKSVQLIFSSFADNAQSNPETDLWEHTSVSAFGTLRFSAATEAVLPSAANSYNALIPYDLAVIPDSGHIRYSIGDPIPKAAYQSLLNGKFANSYGDFYAGSNLPHSTIISLNANGGSVLQNELTVLYGQDFSLPTPERTGYTFSGWHYNNGQVVNINNLVFGSIETLEISAKWIANTYTATFIVDGAIYESKLQTYDAKWELPIPEKSGYKFAGWFTSENGMGQKISADDLYATDGNSTLYAYWDKVFPAWAAVLIIAGSVLLLGAAAAFVYMYRRKKTLVHVPIEGVSVGGNSQKILPHFDEKLNSLATECSLTPREKEIASLILTGKTQTAIAEALFISIPTVKTHIGNLYDKIGVSSKAELFDLMNRQ